MATLWGGRFTQETGSLIKDFNDSLPFDKRLYKVDIKGSIAHARMLGTIGVLSKDESDTLIQGLENLLTDIDNGKIKLSGYEDIHSLVEAILTERIGDLGKKLHTGRSRNDQVALDMKVYTLEFSKNIRDELKLLLSDLLKIMEENQSTYMPGFTHLQKAQPTVLAHHIGAYFEMFIRDYDRLLSMEKRGYAYSPLGSGALCGSTFNLNREMTAKENGFNEASFNSMDSVSDRDYLLEFLADLNVIQMHLSRFCEEIIIWNCDEYKFIDLADSVTTGSSLMPQKKNPDMAELIRGKTGRVYGAYISLLTTMKGLPLAYNKDMQEDKELSFQAFDTVLNSIMVFREMINSAKFNNERMEKSAINGYTNATDVADYLVNKGIPFRDAHGIVGEIVLYCIDKNHSIEECSIEELKKFNDKIESDIYDCISLKSVIEKRVTKGSPGPDAIKEEILSAKSRLASL